METKMSRAAEVAAEAKERIMAAIEAGDFGVAHDRIWKLFCWLNAAFYLPSALGPVEDEAPFEQAALAGHVDHAEMWRLTNVGLPAYREFRATRQRAVGMMRDALETLVRMVQAEDFVSAREVADELTGQVYPLQVVCESVKTMGAVADHYTEDER